MSITEKKLKYLKCNIRNIETSLAYRGAVRSENILSFIIC